MELKPTLIQWEVALIFGLQSIDRTWSAGNKYTVNFKERGKKDKDGITHSYKYLWKNVMMLGATEKVRIFFFSVNEIHSETAWAKNEVLEEKKTTGRIV